MSFTKIIGVCVSQFFRYVQRFIIFSATFLCFRVQSAKSIVGKTLGLRNFRFPKRGFSAFPHPQQSFLQEKHQTADRTIRRLDRLEARKGILR